MYWLLFAVLGIALVVLLVMIFKKKSKKSPSPPPQDLSNLRITDARAGDVLSIQGAGDDVEDLQFTVDRRNRYQSGNETWYEVSGIYHGRRIFVGYYEDDELEVTANLESRKLTLQDLGITEEDLVRMDEEQSRSNTVAYAGQRWSYSKSHEISYFRDGQGNGEGYYSWEFDSEDGKQELCIEKWEGEAFEAMVARRMHPDDCRVFRA